MKINISQLHGQALKEIMRQAKIDSPNLAIEMLIEKMLKERQLGEITDKFRRPWECQPPSLK